MIREIQYSLRRLMGSPGFTIAATLTMAIAIGATASVFSVVDGVLLKAFPFRSPDRVLTIFESNPEMRLPKFSVSPADYLDYRAQNGVFTALAADIRTEFTVTGPHEPERVSGVNATPNVFAVLGVTPVLGRVLAEDSAGPAEVVVSYGYWQRHFGGASSVLGQKLVIDDEPYTIVGVLPSGIPTPAELWTRLSFKNADDVIRWGHYLGVVGRLKPGITPEQAQREMNVIAGRLAQSYPKTNKGWSVVTVPLLDEFVGDVRPALTMLLAAAACVLLIGAANLANLFLVRYLARDRELALRTALGATRGRLVRELLAEALTLGLSAGALGVGVAVIGVRILRALAPATLPRLSDVGIDGRVVAFCVVTSMVTVVIFGALPAWRASGGNLAGALKAGGRSSGSVQHRRLQDGLVVLQLAIALVLLTGAGLLVKSFDHVARTDPGFRPEGVLTARINLPDRYSTPERRSAFIDGVVEALDALPGVQTAGASNLVPGPSGAGTKNGFTIVGDPAIDPSQLPVATEVDVTPDYFRTMGITVQRGRGVLATDDGKAVKVAVIDEMLAHRFFNGRDPLGQRISLLNAPDTVEIVGVAKSVKQGGLLLDEDLPQLYLPFAQATRFFVAVSMRTRGDPAAQAAAVKQAIFSLDRTVPVSDIETMSSRMARSVGTTRFSSFLASMFAVVALVLGMVGIYSVLAYIVRQRRLEIGVRLALGATRANVLGDVLRRALVLTMAGIAIGSVAAWWLARALAELFVGISPHDPAVFVGAAFAFTLAALAAASGPAFGTTRVSPMEALRST